MTKAIGKIHSQWIGKNEEIKDALLRAQKHGLKISNIIINADNISFSIQLVKADEPWFNKVLSYQTPEIEDEIITQHVLKYSEDFTDKQINFTITYKHLSERAIDSFKYFIEEYKNTKIQHLSEPGVTVVKMFVNMHDIVQSELQFQENYFGETFFEDIVLL